MAIGLVQLCVRPCCIEGSQISSASKNGILGDTMRQAAVITNFFILSKRDVPKDKIQGLEKEEQ